jgi:Protein tyrosine and serine/threonine kinase
MTQPYPVRWAPMEAWKHKQWWRGSDTWSFAVTVYECMTHGAMPYAQIENHADVRGFVEGGGRLQRPVDGDSCLSHQTIDSVFADLQRCWEEDVGARPSLADLARRLRAQIDKAPEGYSALASSPSAALTPSKTPGLDASGEYVEEEEDSGSSESASPAGPKSDDGYTDPPPPSDDSGPPSAGYSEPPSYSDPAQTGYEYDSDFYDRADDSEDVSDGEDEASGSVGGAADDGGYGSIADSIAARHKFEPTYFLIPTGEDALLALFLPNIPVPC